MSSLEWFLGATNWLGAAVVIGQCFELRAARKRHAAELARLRDGDFRRWLASLPRHPVEPDVCCPRGVVYLVNTDTLRHSRDDDPGSA